MSLKSLRNIFFDEEECINFLLEKDILKNKQNCEICNSQVTRYTNYYRCKNRDCSKIESVFKNTIFFNSNIKCCDILLIGYFWLCKLNYTSISMMTTFSSITIIKFVNLFRDLAISKLVPEDFIIGGKNIICEIDESKFKKHDDFWVVG
jgi:hypothetical protein